MLRIRSVRETKNTLIDDYMEGVFEYEEMAEGAT